MFVCIESIACTCSLVACVIVLNVILKRGEKERKRKGKGKEKEKKRGQKARRQVDG